MKKAILNIVFITTIIYTLFLGSIYIEATENNNLIDKWKFLQMQNGLNIFFNKLEDSNVYLQQGPFDCNGLPVKCLNNMSDVGAISMNEYNIIGETSYLKPKNLFDYWINEIEGNNAYVADFVGKNLKLQTEDAGVRAATYVKSDVTIAGTGTMLDPYVFTTPQSRKNADVSLLAFYVDNNANGIFNDEINEGRVDKIDVLNNYKFVKAVCTNEDNNTQVFDSNSNRVKYSDTDKSITITNVVEYISCEIYLQNVTDKAESITNFDRIAIGNKFSLVIDFEDKLWAWGNDNGKFVLPQTDVYEPVTILENEEISKVYASNGSEAAIAITKEGKLHVWGGTTVSANSKWNNPYHFMPDSSFIQACIGKYSAAAIDTQGNLFTWGDNTFGIIGDGTKISRNVLNSNQISAGTGKFKKVSCGLSHICSIDTDNNLYCWGSNDNYVLGLSSPGSSESDKIVYFPTQIWSNKKFKDVSCGDTHTLAIGTDNTLYAWGDNSSGQLGSSQDCSNGSAYGCKEVGTLFNSVSANFKTSFAKGLNSKLYYWGGNANGVFGIGNTTNVTEPHENEDYLFMTASSSVSVAIDPDYAIYSAGAGKYMGIGSSAQNYSTFQRVNKIANN